MDLMHIMIAFWKYRMDFKQAAVPYMPTVVAPCISATHVSTQLSRSATHAPPYSLPCRFLWFPSEQHPIVCQLGGSNPQTLAAAAKVVARYGYDEINLNCGCPSERVAGAGCFGAAMMLQPQLVAQCCQAMQDAVPHIPVTVKCRLGMPCKSTHSHYCQVQIRYALHIHTYLLLSSADQVCLTLPHDSITVKCRLDMPSGSPLQFEILPMYAG